jgi:HEAT repeat protein
MLYRIPLIIAALALAIHSPAIAQDEDDLEDLQIAAVEALISAPPERALPAVTKVIRGDYSDDVKESALFILSQIESPEAHELLLEMAQNSEGDLQVEAIEMIGIGGDPDALNGLIEIYENGDRDIREAVLEAFLISGDSKIIHGLALSAETTEDREAALEMLAAMGAIEELRDLMNQIEIDEGIYEWLGIAGDVETLRARATDSSSPEQQIWAIEALGITGDQDAAATLVQIYRDSNDSDVREAALEGLMIAGDSEGMLQLYREATDLDEKSEMLEYLAIMGSDELWDVIDEALEEPR